MRLIDDIIEFILLDGMRMEIQDEVYMRTSDEVYEEVSDNVRRKVWNETCGDIEVSTSEGILE